MALFMVKRMNGLVYNESLSLPYGAHLTKLFTQLGVRDAHPVGLTNLPSNYDSVRPFNEETEGENTPVWSVTGSDDSGEDDLFIALLSSTQMSILHHVDDPIGSIISTIYLEYLRNLANPQNYQERAILLAPTHELVNIINDKMMLSLEAEERSYLSSDSICVSQRDTDFNTELYNTDLLNSIELGGLPKHNLRLKVGVPVMLLRNVDHVGGFSNGTRLQVVEIGERIIKEKI
ncbi:uncharacterized protein [Rutidosis leptorrhynchoides]|uniref:uncharacterized protein n=1 Tax=Rutidosis leptorrhynchoides TaxID=125765 RepID=UPI003A99B0D9